MLAAGLAAFSLLYCTQALLPAIGSSFRVDATLSSLTVSLGTAAIAVAMLPMSSLAESLGRPRVMRVGLSVACVLSFASAAAPDFGLLLVTRALIGVALASVVAVAMGHLGNEVPSARLSAAMGLYVSGTSVGGVLGRLIPGVVQDHGSWRLAVVALTACSSLAVAWFMHVLPAAHPTDRVPMRMSAHVAALKSVWRDHGVRRLTAVAMLMMGGFVACYNYLTYRLVAEPIHLSSTMASLLFLAYLPGTVSSAVAGRLADRVGRLRLLSVSIAMSLIGLVLTLFDGVAWIAVGLVLFTVGFFATHSVASGWVASRSAKHRSQASALYLMAYYLGSSVLGTLVGLAYLHGGWNATVGSIAVLFLIALWCAPRRTERAGNSTVVPLRVRHVPEIESPEEVSET
jgi:YNFM family putative membrane transporter